MENIPSITMLIILTPHALVHESITDEDSPVIFSEYIQEEPMSPILKQ